MLKRKSKRILSIVLAVAMIVGLFPIAAFADEGNETSADAISLPPAVDGVITLEKDTTISTLTLNETGATVIDLNGKTLTYTGGTVSPKNGQVLTFKDSSVSDDQRGGTLKLTGVTGTTAALNPQSDATVNASNIKVECSGSAFFPQGDAAAVNITNCDVTAAVYCVATNASGSENYGVKITVIGSSLIADSKNAQAPYTPYDDCPVMINVRGTLVMDNCTVSGNRQAVLVRAGDASITNCSITLTGKFTDSNDYETTKGWGSGNEVPMAALVVGSQTEAYKADANCNITNTKINAPENNAKPAIYVSSNNESQINGNYKSQLNISGESSAIKGNVVVADGKSDKSNPSSVVISDNATVTGDITNNSASSFVALINGATLEGDVTSDASNVFVENRDNTTSKVVALNVKTGNLYSDLATAVSEAQNGEIVQLLKDITIDATDSTPVSQGVINILSNITLDGNGKTIKAGNNFDYNTGANRGEHHVIAVMDPATNVVIKDLTIDGSNNTSTTPKNGARSGINVWSDDQKINVTVENVSVKNCSTYGLTVTKGDVTIDGLTTENNVWGGINADNKQGDANLIVNNANLSENSSIVFDKGGTGKITATINGGSFRDVVMGKDANEKPITTIDSLRINGGTFKTAGIANAIDVEDYLAPGLVYNPYTGQVYKEPEYTGKYSYEIFTKVGDNGTISVDRYATEGDNVTITVSPDEAYMLDELTVTTGGKEVEVKDNGDGTYTFKMPSADAKIVVTFAEDPDWEPEPEEPAMPFTDVNDNDWFYDVVLYAYDNGLMTGVSATEFAPNQTTTRGMIVSMLARLEGVTSAEDAGFADVAANDWYATAVNWAASVGVVNGYEDNTFRPNAPITREQMAAILYNYADYKGYDVSARADLSDYADAASISSWAEDVLAWANAEGLINGMTATTIDPQGATTRAQTAAMFERFLTAHEA